MSSSNPGYRQPDGYWNPDMWDKELCAKCNEISWEGIFGGSWHNVRVDSWSTGTSSPRSLVHIRDNRMCAFCRLTYHAMVKAEIWHDIEDRAVWLHHDVYAWLLSGPPDPPDRWPSRVEKRIWLRIQRDTEDIEITIKDGLPCEPVFPDEKDVMMTHAACIQLMAADPDCTTGANSDIAKVMRRHSSDGEKNLFSNPERYNAEELRILDRVHASACRGRWMSEEQVDYDMLKHWLWTCSVYHDPQCTPPKSLDSGAETYPFRVIDVHRGCVVSRMPHTPYVCLSYVWGPNPQLKLTAKTLGTLTTEGALFDETTGVAQTIKDAIFVCGMLGQEYLWVDSVCIKQDDSDIRQAEIENMGNIYAGAVLTIIAASGSHADAGLLGARKRSRKATQHMEVIRGRRLMASMPSPGYDAQFSPWERRAWTLQERALSHRRLIFTESQVYFQCKTSYFHEDAVCEIPGKAKLIKFPDIRSPFASVEQHDFDRSDGFPMYEDIVRGLTRRKLTFDGDVLNACTGIFKVDQERRASRGRSTILHFGLPVAIFSKALCWMSTQDSPGRRRSDFPSWSWAGWDTAASYDLLRFNVICDENIYLADESDAAKAAAFLEARSTGENAPGNPLLTFRTTSAILRVDRISDDPKYPNSFAMWSPHDQGLCLGHIQLAESMRASRPDEMEFIVIAIESYENGWKHNNTNNRSKWTRPEKYSYGVKLMCIEWIGDVAQRVQMSYQRPNSSPWLTTPSEGSQSIANWQAVKPVEKVIMLS